MERLVTAAAALGIRLTPAQARQFEAFTTELLAWNLRMNLTAITSPEGVEARHHLDSLSVALAFPAGRASLRVADVGAGAGFPGIPLKIAFPLLRLTLVEATQKKVRFLAHVVGVLGLEGVEIVHARAEEIAHLQGHREGYDAVIARALAPLPALAELTLPLCAVGGVVVAQKQGDISKELARSQKAIGLLGGKLREVRPVAAMGLMEGRLLVIIDKVGGTPQAYPRRPGMPAKRPLQ